MARTLGTIACDDEFIGVKKNVQRKFGTILELKADNSVIIGYDDHQETLDNIDLIVLCTGYEFDFSFLSLDKEGLIWTSKQVRPLYHHLFFALDPTLTFIGLPMITVPFPLFELQAKWAAQVYSGKV